MTAGPPGRRAAGIARAARVAHMGGRRAKFIRHLLWSSQRRRGPWSGLRRLPRYPGLRERGPATTAATLA